MPRADFSVVPDSQIIAMSLYMDMRRTIGRFVVALTILNDSDHVVLTNPYGTLGECVNLGSLLR